ncbi:hypothetical protein HYALB_00001671 [Hymenoscyphus albidus]|uniref:Uncharacterized protein n=1 Tax=Hymenoscyphus albidus TaxID=595503 RepID=A0A9N9LEH4_9HELO|nr:hypothetical protein HYALB_00001671 [Hymenoscyphus albidus]
MCQFEVTRFHFKCGHICHYTFPSPNPDCHETKHQKYFQYENRCLGCLGGGTGTVKETITCGAHTDLVEAKFTMAKNPANFSLPELCQRRSNFLAEINVLITLKCKKDFQSLVVVEEMKGVHPKERIFFISENARSCFPPFFKKVPVPAYLSPEYLAPAIRHRSCAACKNSRQTSAMSAELCRHAGDALHSLPCDCGAVFSLGCLETHFSTGSNACPACDWEFRIVRDSDIPVMTEEDVLSEALQATVF